MRIEAIGTKHLHKVDRCKMLIEKKEKKSRTTPKTQPKDQIPDFFGRETSCGARRKRNIGSARRRHVSARTSEFRYGNPTGVARFERKPSRTKTQRRRLRRARVSPFLHIFLTRVYRIVSRRPKRAAVLSPWRNTIFVRSNCID